MGTRDRSDDNMDGRDPSAHLSVQKYGGDGLLAGPTEKQLESRLEGLSVDLGYAERPKGGEDGSNFQFENGRPNGLCFKAQESGPSSQQSPKSSSNGSNGLALRKGPKKVSEKSPRRKKGLKSIGKGRLGRPKVVFKPVWRAKGAVTVRRGGLLMLSGPQAEDCMREEECQAAKATECQSPGMRFEGAAIPCTRSGSEKSLSPVREERAPSSLELLENRVEWGASIAEEDQGKAQRDKLQSEEQPKERAQPSIQCPGSFSELPLLTVPSNSAQYLSGVDHARPILPISESQTPLSTPPDALEVQKSCLEMSTPEQNCNSTSLFASMQACNDLDVGKGDSLRILSSDNLSTEVPEGGFFPQGCSPSFKVQARQTLSQMGVSLYCDKDVGTGFPSENSERRDIVYTRRRPFDP